MIERERERGKNVRANIRIGIVLSYGLVLRCNTSEKIIHGPPTELAIFSGRLALQMRIYSIITKPASASL